MENIDFDEQTKQVYRLTEDLLNHTQITHVNRARLFHWLSEQTTNQSFMRDTYALACYYVDLYFAKGNIMPLNDLQNLGLAALILAGKQNQSRVPSIRFDIFPKADLLRLQSELVLRLNYYLNPVTYIQQLDFLFQNWDQFTQMEKIYPQVKYFASNINSYSKIKMTCQKMDCINLVAKIMKFNQNQVVLTFFYLQNKMFCVPQTSELLNSELLTSVQQIVNQIQSQDEYKAIFNNFLEYCGVATRPNIEIAQYILAIMPMKVGLNGPSVGALNYVQYAKYMTKNERALSKAKRAIEGTRQL